MKSKVGLVFLIATMIGILSAIDLVATHIMMPAEKISPVLTQELYRVLIAKWFVAGLVFGMILMFLMVESWIWRNWRSWNKFCCDHHERVYRSTMGISQGAMLRRK